MFNRLTRLRKRGFSLTEVLVSIFIIGLTVGVIGAVIVASTSIWRQVSSRTQAFPPAYLALTRIANELRDAAWVWSPKATDTRTDWIVVYKPMVDTTDSARQAAGINALPLAVDLTGVHAYYLSDSTGDFTHTGTYLWMQTFNQNVTTGAVTNTDLRVIAKNVQTLTFQTNQDDTRMYAIYSMALTVVGQESSTSYSSQFSTKIAFNNPTAAVPPLQPPFIPAGEIGI